MRIGVLAWMLLGLVATTAGCMKRTERIVVSDDGGVRFLLEFETDDPGELRGGDALPTMAGGWLVVESEREDDEGRRRYRLEAEAIYSPGSTLPASWAAPFEDERDPILRFPTVLVIEPRRDAVYYHLHRRYEPRAWAHRAAARAMREESLGALGDRTPGQLTDPERRTLVAGLLEAEIAEDRVLAREAFLEAPPAGPQDAWFDVDSALGEVERALDVQQMIELLAIEDEAEQAEAFDEEQRGRRLLVRDAMEAALRAHVDAGSVNAFLAEFARGIRRRAITDDLADDAFEITVTMPGEIVGHNGTAESDGHPVWRFDGTAFRDRAVELMVTSRRMR